MDAEIGVPVVVGVKEDDVRFVGSLSETTEGTEEHREKAFHSEVRAELHFLNIFPRLSPPDKM
jgi:hypothetical protein